MIGEPAVSSVKKPQNAGHFCEGVEGPCPPDLPREIDNRFPAAIDFSVIGRNAHFPEQLRGRQRKQSLRARILQSGKTETAGFQCAAETAREGGADAAVAVKENPTAKGAPSFRISNF